MNRSESTIMGDWELLTKGISSNINYFNLYRKAHYRLLHFMGLKKVGSNCYCIRLADFYVLQLSFLQGLYYIASHFYWADAGHSADTLFLPFGMLSLSHTLNI